jgi:hypothetical protein
MTKADLITFLEPFNDDIRILVKGYRLSNIFLYPIKPKYCVKKGALRIRDESLLEDCEGYIMIEDKSQND